MVLRPILALVPVLVLAPVRPAGAQCSGGQQVAPYCDPSLSYEGCCQAEGLFWCENGVTCHLDCSLNPFCGWDDGQELYNCGTTGDEDPSQQFPLDCPADEDGDGSSFPYDCDDDNDAVYPFAPEACDGILDNNCDGNEDLFELDNDGDGYSECDGDCNDMQEDIYPGAEDECGDGIDGNCDGDFEWEYDEDGDGYPPCAGDCDEGNPDINPGADEDCNDAIDNDCDGMADGYDPDCETGDDDDDDASADDDDTGLGSRSGPYGVRCSLDATRNVGSLTLLVLLTAASLLRRRR